MSHRRTQKNGRTPSGRVPASRFGAQAEPAAPSAEPRTPDPERRTLDPEPRNPDPEPRAPTVEDIEPERYEFSEGARYTFDLERRDFMRLVGGGLVVLTALPRAIARQESGRGAQGRGEATNLGAWLHIDDRGQVTAYTGKVEIGQNVRTSLAQAVADELRVPMESVAMVMADTDLTPYDAGTFGSQSTPRMGRQLSRAAATAREILIDRAAAKWGVDRASLSARDGRVVTADGRSLTYGELTSGQQLTGVVAAEPGVTPAGRWEVRGRSRKKVNGAAFVTGRHEFTPDVVRPGMLHARIVRPDAIGATLATLDDSRARAIGGVTVVRDAELVGVVAPSERLARRAAELVQAQWSRPAAQPDSATVYEHLKTRPSTGGGRGGAPFTTGDVARAHAESARTFEASYRIPYIAHVPLEPRAAVAEWLDGKLTVWTGTQRPFGVRAELMDAFRLREDQVRVIVPDMGSGYGGKHTGDAAIEAARLAKAAGKPVKLVWTRAEEFMWAYFRPAGVIDIKAAVDADARLIAWEFDNWNSGSAGIRSPYDVANQRVAFHPSASPLRQGSYRGLAATANHYAREMHMDAIARALKVDPVEFRLRHLKDERMRNVLTALAGKIGWPRTPARGRAIGIACGTEKGSYVGTAAELSRTPAGFKVERLVVTFECGAIVNPDGVHNQVEGSIVQGLGGALFEAIEFRDGRIVNGSLAKYRVPRFADVPPIEIVLLDRKDLPSAGAGETPIVCVAPAIGSAARAFGNVATALPVTLQA
jgi:isoquinoline 1-oxidoreductase